MMSIALYTIFGPLLEIVTDLKKNSLIAEQTLLRRSGILNLFAIISQPIFINVQLNCNKNIYM